MSSVEQLFPIFLVVLGSGLAVWSWWSAGGLPRLAFDRNFLLEMEPDGVRRMDLVMSLLIVGLGILARSS